MCWLPPCQSWLTCPREAGGAIPIPDEIVDRICEMGFAKDDVRAALRASFGNPDRAVEYLMNVSLPAGGIASLLAVRLLQSLAQWCTCQFLRRVLLLTSHRAALPRAHLVTSWRIRLFDPLARPTCTRLPRLLELSLHRDLLPRAPLAATFSRWLSRPLSSRRSKGTPTAPSMI